MEARLRGVDVARHGAALALLLVMAAAVGACGVVGDSYGPEDAKYRTLCAHFDGDPRAVYDSEFSGRRNTSTTFLFDDYLLKVPLDDFPSSMRQDLLSFRQAVADLRAGRLDAGQARAAAAAGMAAIEHERNDGACSYFRTHPLVR